MKIKTTKNDMINLLEFTDVAISISGGKDSQTILRLVHASVVQQGYAGNVIAIHADTGAEWPQSLPHCKMLCDHYGFRLYVGSPFRSLPDHIERRCTMMAAQEPRGKPGWPSAQQRYCTSDCKRSPIEKVLRRLYPARGSISNILSVTGERREESAKRKKMIPIEANQKLSAGKRTVIQYRPALDLTLQDVWRHIAGTGLPRHVAYDRGNKRLSCAICVLANDDDIRNGAAECPRLAERYLRIEREHGFTFKNGKRLADILGGT